KSFRSKQALRCTGFGHSSASSATSARAVLSILPFSVISTKSGVFPLARRNLFHFHSIKEPEQGKLSVIQRIRFLGYASLKIERTVARNHNSSYKILERYPRTHTHIQVQLPTSGRI